MEDENSRQNLTRLPFDPLGFYEGQIIDSLVLWSELGRFTEKRVVDLGSGNGVPGIPLGVLGGYSIRLVESEIGKCFWLKSATELLGLSQDVETIHGRISEETIGSGQILTCRALGKVEQIYNWSKKSSTWNKLILLKGRSWEEEWENTPKVVKKHLNIERVTNYISGEYSRKLVTLVRN
jgi:16S rRNA (guanine527-N7)-methyltransferase